MVFATGDTHGNFLRFRPENFPEQKNMTKSDYVIICGDFGGVWDGSRKERQTLDWLESLPFTVLFVSGNHENFDLLKVLPTEEWHGGKVQFIRPHVIHLLRGQVFEIEGYTFYYNIFTDQGTAASRVFFRIVAKAVRMRASWPDVHLQGPLRP